VALELLPSVPLLFSSALVCELFFLACITVLLYYNTALMPIDFNESQPIYRQLRDHVVAMILDGILKEGDALPSIRNVAAEYRVNPLTVLKGYQQLVDEQLIEKRRGLGMFVNIGAKNLLLKGERQKFLDEEWPRVHATIQRLGLNSEDLLKNGSNRKSNKEDR